MIKLHFVEYETGLGAVKKWHAKTDLTASHNDPLKALQNLRDLFNGEVDAAIDHLLSHPVKAGRV